MLGDETRAVVPNPVSDHPKPVHASNDGGGVVSSQTVCPSLDTR
jgi:hypothetical protein